MTYVGKVHLDRGNGTPWCFVKAKKFTLGGDTEANCEICFKQRETAPGPNQLLVCCKCKEKKPGSEFYSDAASATGKDAYCNGCRMTLQKGWNKANPAAYEAKMRRSRANHPEWQRANAVRQAEEKPKARYAIAVIRNEIKRGRLLRGPCEVCAATKRVHGHHNDYDKPLEVRWLCPKHHREWHEEHGPGANLDGEPVLIGRFVDR